MAAITAGVILPSIYFWFANRDNEIYQRQPQWVKDNYWVVVVGDTPYRIPKPFDLGIVFGTGTEQFLDYVASDHPESIKNGREFALDFIQNQMKNLNPLPTFLVPPLETYMNKSFFTGKPIVPDYMDKKLLSKYQYTTYTSEVAKGISRAINTMIGNDYTKLDNPIFIDKIDKIFPEERYGVKITGKSLLFLKGTKYLIKNLILSLSLAILLIAFFMAFLFRSLKMIIISLIPNLLPLIITAGVMGFTGIPLKPSTCLLYTSPSPRD